MKIKTGDKVKMSDKLKEILSNNGSHEPKRIWRL